ncbi:TIGR02265 family protein [Archangium sp.]|uniref:TIGR02265 family protein n=1 Tax=Archangium sp. TaxID=1872627 RepID=UPI002ED9DDBC
MSPDADSECSYDAEQDLEQRLLLVPPETTTRGFLFSSILKAVRELGGDEQVVQSCLEASGEKEFVELFNYPTRALLQMLAAAARGLSPRYGSVEEALRQLGRKGGASNMASSMGRSAQLMTQGDPKKLLATMQVLYGIAMTYSEPTVVWKGPKRGVLVIHQTYTPLPYHVGGAQETARWLGLEKVKVRGRTTGVLSLELDFSWD